MLAELEKALADLDAAREDAPSAEAVTRLGNLAWSHYYTRLDKATQALETAARAAVAFSPPDPGEMSCDRADSALIVLRNIFEWYTGLPEFANGEDNMPAPLFQALLDETIRP